MMPTGRRRATALLGLASTLAIGVVLGGTSTHWFGFAWHDPDRAAAPTACEDEIRQNLTVPTSARFENLSERKDILIEDDAGRWPDIDKVRAVWALGGTVNSENVTDQPGRVTFGCRVYFFPDGSHRTTVDFGDADESRQRTLGPR
jgi:hypothetical protein